MIPFKIIVGGTPEQQLETTLELVQQAWGKPVPAIHPDLLYPQIDNSIGIGQVRQLEKYLSRKPYQEKAKVVIIRQAEKLTLAAQNALLKVLEEPPDHSLIFLLLPQADLLLDTVLSRGQVIKLGLVEKKPTDSSLPTTNNLIKEISKARVGERIKIASQQGRDRDLSLRLVEEFILIYEQELRKKADLKTAQSLKLLQKTLTRIKANLNPELALGNLFLRL